MAKGFNILIGLCLLYGCNARSVQDVSVTVPAGGGSTEQQGETAAPDPSAAVDTVIMLPPLDSSQRLPVDPPATYPTTPPPIPIEAKLDAPGMDIRATVQRVYLSQVGVREKTGNNDGRAVEMYLRSVGLGKGYSWCAAFVHWSLDSGGLRNPITAWSPTAHNPTNPVWFQQKLKKEPLPGDVFTIWFASKKRIAHTGFFNRRINNSVFETVEGNTSEEGSREGDGVYKRRRSLNATYSITRWIDP